MPATRHRELALATAFALGLGAAPARADEGQWKPEQIRELDENKLKSLGLAIEPSKVWNGKGGLLRAAVNLSGCSASFVSERGLIASNHHCAYRAVQGQSTPEKDLLKNGFVAKSPGDELPAKGYTVQVLRSIRDVTKEVLAAAHGAKDDRARHEAIELAEKKLVLQCEKKDPALRCQVASFYLGSHFELFEALEIRDVRLVYAPPSSVGEYGGEVDNWMWPRHTGDFALMRAYVGPDGKSAEHSPANVPYRPPVHLAIGADGVRPGEFVAVMGYPGRTYRYLPASEVERHLSQVFPSTIDLYGQWLTLLEAAARRGKDVAIKVAALNKSLANRHKNARGMVDGIQRMRLLERRKREERRLAEWAKQPGRERHARALTDLGKLSDERRAAFPREFLLEQLSRGPNLLAAAIDIVRRARERKKPDLEREEAYMDRGAPLLWKLQERRIRDFDARVDAELLATLALRARELPEAQRIDALAKLAAGKELAAAARALEPRLRASKLSDPAFAKRLFDGEPEATERSADPLIALARALAPELEALEATKQSRSGLESRAGPLYFEMLKSVRGGPVYPDANGTLRFSYATVKGYEPKDGLIAKPQTTLSGAVNKHTGESPFDLPRAVIDKAPEAKNSYWADAELDDLPLCFLSTADTTGGNSGSAVINGKGELVGLNFDRVWENIAGDFGYSPERSRNISVDVRFLLWLLDRVENAGPLLSELGVAEYRSAPVQRSRAGLRRPRPGAPRDEPKPEPRSGCACGIPARGGAAPLLLLAVGLGLALGRRRRRAKGDV